MKPEKSLHAEYESLNENLINGCIHEVTLSSTITSQTFGTTKVQKIQQKNLMICMMP